MLCFFKEKSNVPSTSPQPGSTVLCYKMSLQLHHNQVQLYFVILSNQEDIGILYDKDISGAPDFTPNF